jgi:hypothetical protein
VASDGNSVLLEQRRREHLELEHRQVESRRRRDVESGEHDARRLCINLLKRAVSGLTAFELDMALAVTGEGDIEAAPLAEASTTDREMGLDFARPSLDPRHV